MGKFRYYQGGASAFVEKVENVGDPLLKAAAAVIDQQTKVFEAFEDFVKRHGRKILGGALGLHYSSYDDRSYYCYECGHGGDPNPSPPEEVAFLYEAIQRLDRSCDELIALIEVRVPNPSPKRDG